jgi:hypothetical protein
MVTIKILNPQIHRFIQAYQYTMNVQFAFGIIVSQSFFSHYANETSQLHGSLDLQNISCSHILLIINKQSSSDQQYDS